MTGAVLVLAPPGAPALNVKELLSRPLVSALFEIAAGDLDFFVRDPMVRGYLEGGAYVIAEFEDASDALELERRFAMAAGGVH
jgi:hypothetical protein